MLKALIYISEYIIYRITLYYLFKLEKGNV